MLEGLFTGSPARCRSPSILLLLGKEIALPAILGRVDADSDVQALAFALDRADPARARPAARSRRLRPDATPLPARLGTRDADARQRGAFRRASRAAFARHAAFERARAGTGSASSPDTTVTWKAQAEERPTAPSASTRPPRSARNARPDRNATAPSEAPRQKQCAERARHRYCNGRARGKDAGMTDYVVVEVSRRGRMLVGEPVFTPGVPIPLDSTGSATSDRGDLAVVRKQRGRARLEARARACRPDRERPRGAARARGAPPRVRAVRPAGAQPRGAGRPARAPDVHDRPGDREGLRRRDLDTSRGRRDPRLGAHRRRLVVRARRLAARPRRRRARASRVRPGLRRPDAPARARGRCLLAPTERRPALRHRRDPSTARCRQASRTSTAR